MHMSEAKLAVVPVLLDWFAHGLCSGNASDHVKNTTAIVEKHMDTLPHVVIAASFASSEIVPQLQVALPNLRVGTYVAVGSWPASMPHGSDFVTGSADEFADGDSSDSDHNGEEWSNGGAGGGADRGEEVEEFAEEDEKAAPRAHRACVFTGRS